MVVVITFASLLFFRSMNDERTKEPISILRAVVGVVPVRSILVVDGEIVQEASSGRDRALCDPHAAVHPVGPILKQSVPMDAGCVAEAICHINQNPIAPVSPDEWTWKLAVNDKHSPQHTLSSQQRV